MGKDSPALDHVILMKGPQRRQYERKGNGGDLLLLRGHPEPLTNFAEESFAARLVEDNICAYCTEDGHLEDGSLHPDIKAAAEADAPASDPAGNADPVATDSAPNGLVTLAAPLPADDPAAAAAAAVSNASAPAGKKKP